MYIHPSLISGRGKDPSVIISIPHRKSDLAQIPRFGMKNCTHMGSCTNHTRPKSTALPPGFAGWKVNRRSPRPWPVRLRPHGSNTSAAVALLRGCRQPARLFNHLRLGVHCESPSPLGYCASSRPYMVLPLSRCPQACSPADCRLKKGKVES